MAFFTKDSVHQLAASQGIGTRGMLNESVERRFQAISSNSPLSSAKDESRKAIGSKTFNIFLSHSSLDASLVLAIYTVLTSRGYHVYLDRIHDRNLNRQNVTRHTADVIRKRMTQCDSLFVATTSNTPQSKWVPWELGFTDGLTGNAAILPIVDNIYSSFAGLTYFDLYPTVGDRPSHVWSNDLEITERNGHVSPWGSWIHGPKAY